jgi:hypothetical protein
MTLAQEKSKYAQIYNKSGQVHQQIFRTDPICLFFQFDVTDFLLDPGEEVR